MVLRSFQELKKNKKYNSLWFHEGKEITSSEKFIKIYELKKELHYTVLVKNIKKEYFMTPEGEKYLRQEIKKRTEEVPERKISESTNCVERKSTDNTTYDECSKQSEADLEQLKNIKTQQNNCAADYSQKQDHFDNELVEIVTNVLEFVDKIKSLDLKGVINKLENKNTLC